MVKKWTEEEVEQLKSMVADSKSNKYMAEQLGKSSDSIRLKLKSMGMKADSQVKKWTDENVKQLLELADSGLTNNEIGIKINRNKRDVGAKLSRLGYKREEKYTDESDEMLKQLVDEGYSNKEISEKMGYTLGSVIGRLATLKYKRPEVPYLYSVNEIIGQGTLKVIEQTTYSKRNIRAYLVQSLTYPSETYVDTEARLKKGGKDLYLSGRRICPENSLWANENIRKFIVDVEEAKRTAPFHNKPITVRCPKPNCQTVKKVTPNSLSTKEHISCNTCASYLKMPEKIFYQYLLFRNSYEDKHITFEDFNREFDFMDKFGNLYEVNGEQHYSQSNSSSWKDAYNRSVISDNEKVEYCKNKNINLTFIDCRKSNFNFIITNIQEALNDNLTTDEILTIKNNVMKMDEDLDDMLKEFADGVPVQILNEKYDMKEHTIYSLANRFGIKRNNNFVRVRCITTGKVFNTVSDAGRTYNIPTTNISKACRGTCRTAGQLNGVKLEWECVDVKIEKVIKSDIKYNAKNIRCITTGKIFKSIKDAAKEYNIKSSSNISASINPNNPRKYAGTLPDGTPLTWEFVDNE